MRCLLSTGAGQKSTHPLVSCPENTAKVSLFFRLPAPAGKPIPTEAFPSRPRLPAAQVSL
jgi:hypothetical protein